MVLKRRSADVFVGIASVGSRVTMLESAVASLIDQVDQMGVYLNHYDDVPSFLKHRRITVRRSQDHGDARDNGKFFFLDRCTHRFYATADDDIVYPPGYIDRLRSSALAAGPNTVVGVHGAVYPTAIVGLLEPRLLYHFAQSTPYVMPVHLLGTGTTLFDQTEWKLRYSEFGEPGMADVWFAVAARARAARMFVVNRDKRWLEPIDDDDGESDAAATTLWAEAAAGSSLQARLLIEADVSAGGYDRLIADLLASPRLAEDLSLSHAVACDEMRRRLGWSPLSQAAGPEACRALERAHAGWESDLAALDIDLARYRGALIGILQGSVDADTTIATRALLDRLSRMATTERPTWSVLPFPLRFDTREDRRERLDRLLTSLTMARSSADASSLWPHLGDVRQVSPDDKLHAERAGIDTSFQQSARLARRARRDPLATATLLREYLEMRDWGVVPDVAAWRTTFGTEFERLEVQVLLAVGMLRCGQLAAAERLVGSIQRRWPELFDTRLVAAVVAAAGDGRLFERALAVIDGSVGDLGMDPYTALLIPDSTNASHWIDRLAAPPTEPSAGSGDVVSVVMTVHNDEATIASAVRSVLASRDVEFELIVVDDASSDGTRQILAGIDDPRVQVVVNDVNLGTYMSRNRAIERARGAFVTFADADDWSHPQRFAFQRRLLEHAPHVIGCTVAHVRLRPDGEPDLENNLSYVGHGPVSLMYRRWAVGQVGGFDHVRSRGDIEFLGRLRARFGGDAVMSYPIPLVLATSAPTSNSKRFADEPLGRYRRAARRWHDRDALTDRLHVPLSGAARAPFVAPEELLVMPAATAAGAALTPTST